MKPTVNNRQPASYGPRSTARFRLRPTVSGLPAAFTLVELLVVIVVIAILMGITLPVSKYAILRAKMARQEVMLAKIRSALDDYRAAYGEYPITPPTNGTYNPEAAKHYWDKVVPDIQTYSNSVFTNVDLSTNVVEHLEVDGAKYNVDYSLAFPLALRQEREGRRPLAQLDKVTILHIVYQFDEKRDAGQYVGKRKTKGGGWIDAQINYVRGRPVDRTKVIDPVSGNQWKYICNDGVSYVLTTNAF